MTDARRAEICCVLMAGGQSRRMGGGDKCLRDLGGKTILQRIVERVAPQVGPLVLNANGDPARFGDYGLPVEADVVEGFAGPLAGVLTGMEWAARNAPACRWLLSVPCDAPFLPRDLAARLLAAVETEGAQMACAVSEGRDHPVVALWPVALAGELRAAMIDEGIRKVDAWTARYKLAKAGFAPEDTKAGRLDPFFNTNRPEDLAEARRYL
jgi:molybdopterin-guanine dinucleotide biosynthesis protein A